MKKEELRMSEKFLCESSTDKLLKINTYLLLRHTHHFRYENYDKLEEIVNFMQEVDDTLFDRFVNGEVENS